MDETTFTYRSADGLDIAVRRWSALGEAGRRRRVGRWARCRSPTAWASTRPATPAWPRRSPPHGWVVYANDHRGHGRSAVGLDGAGPPEALGDFGPGGWNGLVDDLVRLDRRIGRRACPGRPRVLLGHSMGSFAAQQLVLDHSQRRSTAWSCRAPPPSTWPPPPWTPTPRPT